MKNIKENFKYLFLAVLFAAVVFVWYAVFWESRSGLTVAFLDVGQGDAIFIQAENGNQVLVDGGQNKKVLSELGKVMPFYDRSIDMVVESHPDEDHIGGLAEVSKHYSVGLIMESGVDSGSAVYQEIKNVVAEKGIKNILARRGMKINLDEGAYLLILFPDRDVSKLDSNYSSVVARLVYGKNSFLLTGDSPAGIEEYLVSLDAKNLKSDVLKVGHHGSDTSTSEIFLGYVGPRYAVISVGKDNKYGHPRKEILERLKRFGAEIFRTDESGAIKMKSDGNNIVIER